MSDVRDLEQKIEKEVENIKKTLKEDFYSAEKIKTIMLESETKINATIHTLNSKVVDVENNVEKHEISNSQTRKAVLGMVSLIVTAVIGALVKLVIK